MRELLAEPDGTLTDESAALQPSVTHTESGWRYEPALDGLRALAVVAVLVFHNAGGGAPGGFLGVDIFFVLSGFLITSLLIREWQGARGIDVLSFWGRRARRLLPALGVLLVLVACYVAYSSQPVNRGSVRLDGIATMFYVENWRLILTHHSYFASFNGLTPLGHTWSLAIEEQWYLIWPLALGAMLHFARGRLSRVVPVVIALAVASAGLTALLYNPSSDPSRVYYGTDTRVQALLIGALLAFAMVARGRATTKTMRVVLEVAGLLAAAWVFWIITHVDSNTTWLYRGGLAAFAAATALVIAAAVQPRSPVIGRVLSVPPLRWIGLISYGIYLFHWPIFLWLTPTQTGLYGWRLFTIRVDAVLLLAIASYFLVEMPVRRGTWRRPVLTFAVPAAAIVAALIFATSSWATPRPGAAARTSLPTVPTPTAHGRQLRVLVAGDSVGWTIAYVHPDAFDAVARMGIDLHNTAIIGCGIGGGSDAGGGGTSVPQGCKVWPDVYRKNVQIARPDISLLLTGAWELVTHKVNGIEMMPGLPAYRDYLFHRLDLARSILTANGAHLVIGLTPCFDRPVMADTDTARQQNDIARLTWLDGVWTDYAQAHPADVSVVDLRAFICPVGTVRDTIDGVLLRSDGMHFTDPGAVVLWKWLTPQLQTIASEYPHG